MRNKSEVRSPKSERRPKSESRRPKPEGTHRQGLAFRISDLGLLLEFGREMLQR